MDNAAVRTAGAGPDRSFIVLTRWDEGAGDGGHRRGPVARTGAGRRGDRGGAAGARGRGGQPAARREAHVFQAIDEPGTLLYVGEWADRAAFELYRGESGPDAIEAAVARGR